jgi:hypothetical protein
VPLIVEEKIMKLKSFKTIQVLYVIVSASALLVACHTQVTEPLKLMSGSSLGSNQTLVSSDGSKTVENYGVTAAKDVVFSSEADKPVIDFAY